MKRLLSLVNLVFLIAALACPTAQPPTALPAATHPWVWVDSAGDIWVENQAFRWNLTGGKQLTLAGSPLAWDASSGSRLVEALFLDPAAGGELRAKIVSVEPEVATIYLERRSATSAEGLELTVTATGTLLTLRHRRLEGSGPLDSDSRPLAFNLAGESGTQEFSGVIPAPEGALRSEAVAYALQYAPGRGVGVARLQRVGAASLPLPPHADSCLPLYGPRLCEQQASLLPGTVVLQEYLLLFEAHAPSPLDVMKEWAARLQLALPDLDAASIARTPRYDYDAFKNQPAPGDALVFTARLANRGGLASGSFAYRWQIDGLTILDGVHPGLQAGQSATLDLNWTWAAGTHIVTLEVDPANALVEVSEANNRLEERTDALAVGLWVEQSVYDYFNLHQVDLGIGSNSWDDWAQRQMRTWNQIFEASINPLTPQGVTERVRLDKVTVVPDGALPNPYPSNTPDINDKSIDLQWGFPSELVGVPSTHPQYGPFYLDYPPALLVEYSLMHELSHARYLDDLYTLNVVADPTTLSNAIGPSDTSFNVGSSVGSGAFTPPAYLAIEGELVVCQSASGTLFSDCTRGAEGTTPRAHAGGAGINRAAVRLQDGQGNLVMGSPAMPLLAFNDHLYLNHYGDDLMNGGQIYRQHSAYALNRIVGQRPVCGNYNASCNLGEYQNDTPAHNVLIVAQGKQPLAGATLEVFRARPFPYQYNGENYWKDPDEIYQTDANGQVDLGHFPFDPQSGVANSYNRVLLLRVTYGGQAFYRFLEITRFNEAYWAGDQEWAYYYVDPTTSAVDLWIRPGEVSAQAGAAVTIPATWGNYGATSAPSPSLVASFDPSLQVISAEPPATSIGPGQVSWALSAGGSLQIGKLSLRLQVPQNSPATTYWVNWQTSASDEADPNDNQATSALHVNAPAARVYLPIVQKIVPTLPTYTLSIPADSADAEIGNIECAQWLPCHNASAGNFFLGGYANATVESTFDSTRQVYNLKRIFLFFDTSALPDQAVITRATLRFYSGPWQSGNTAVHVVASSAGFPPDAGDFGALTYASGGTATPGANQWAEISLNSGALAWIHPTGRTSLALIHALDLANTTPTTPNSLLIALGENTANGPALVITYTLP